MPNIPVAQHPADFGGVQTEELTSPSWLAVCRNLVEEFFAIDGNAEGHHSPFVIVGFRNNRDPDEFNDLVGAYNLLTKELRLWRATANPGDAPMRRAGKLGVHPDGVARLKPGMTRNCFKYGFHCQRLDSPALTQHAVIPYERYNTDTETWYTPTPQKICGFNCHRAKFTGTARWVGDWSHGCLTFPDRHAHWSFLLWIGYPKDGPAKAPVAVRNRRHSLVLFDITPTSSEE